MSPKTSASCSWIWPHPPLQRPDGRVGARFGRIARGVLGKRRIESGVLSVRPPYDPQCYLCPGNVRANGERNPEYTSTFVFTQRLRMAFLPDTQRQDATRHPLLRAHSARASEPAA